MLCKATLLYPITSDTHAHVSLNPLILLLYFSPNIFPFSETVRNPCSKLFPLENLRGVQEVFLLGLSFISDYNSKLLPSFSLHLKLALGEFSRHFLANYTLTGSQVLFVGLTLNKFSKKKSLDLKKNNGKVPILFKFKIPNKRTVYMYY